MTLFANGDVARRWPAAAAGGGGGGRGGGGRESYLFAAAGAWETTLLEGAGPEGKGPIRVFHFASGQVEAHLPCGTKHVLLPPRGEEGGGGGGGWGGWVVAAGGGAGPVPVGGLCPWVMMEAPEGTDAERLWRGEW